MNLENEMRKAINNNIDEFQYWLFESSLNDQIDKAVKCIPLYIQDDVSNDKILTVSTPTSKYEVCNKKTLDDLIKFHGDRFSTLYKVMEKEC